MLVRPGRVGLPRPRFLRGLLNSSALAIDNATAKAGDNATSISLTHNTGASANLLVASLAYNVPANFDSTVEYDAPISVTANGVALTRLASKRSMGGAIGRNRASDIWYLENPPKGAVTVEVMTPVPAGSNGNPPATVLMTTTFNSAQSPIFDGVVASNATTDTAGVATISTTLPDASNDKGIVLAVGSIRTTTDPTFSVQQALVAKGRFGSGNVQGIVTQQPSGAAVTPSFSWPTASMAAMLAVTVRGASASVPVTPPAAADFAITNDAEFDALLAMPAEERSGKVATIAPGEYSTKTFSGTHAAPFTLRALDPNNKPVIKNLRSNNAINWTLNDIKSPSTDWIRNGSRMCLFMENNAGGLTFSRCEFYSGYRGGLRNIDPTFEAPEFACILPVIDATGALVDFNVTRPFVDNLLKDGARDGVFPLIFTNGGSLNWTTLPQATMTIVDGYIQPGVGPGGFTITNPGAGATWKGGGIPSAGEVNGTQGTLSHAIEWEGMMPFGQMLPRGIGTSGSFDQVGDITFNDCISDCVADAYKFSCREGRTVNIIGARMDRVYSDYISIGTGGGSTPGTPANVNIRWALMTRPLTLGGDPKDPHGDGIQANGGAQSVSSVWDITGVVVVRGVTRGRLSQFVFLATPKAGTGYRGRVTGCYHRDGGGNGIAVYPGSDFLAWGNTVAGYDPSVSRGDTTLKIEIATPGGGNSNTLIGNNITETLVLKGSGSDRVNGSAFPNVSLGRDGSVIPFGDVFEEPVAINPPRMTLEQVIPAMKTKGVYLNKGAGAPGYVDFINRTIDRTKEPTFVEFPTLVDQAPGSEVWSVWRRIIGGPDAVAISVSAGAKYQIADDVAGLNATAATSAASTTQRGKYIRVSVVNQTGSSQATLATITLNGWSWTFASTTPSTEVYPQVRMFQTSLRAPEAASMAPNGVNSHTGGLFIPRLSIEAINSANNIMARANNSTSPLVLSIQSSGRLRIRIRSNAGNDSTLETNQSLGGLVDRSFMASWDTSKDTHDEGFDFWVSGVIGGYFGTPSWSSNRGPVGWNDPMGSGNHMIGINSTAYGFRLGGIWLHDRDRPDWSDPVVRARTAPDQIGNAGQNITGTAPLIWMHGDAAAYNTPAGINLGTGPAYSGGAGQNGGLGAVTDV